MADFYNATTITTTDINLMVNYISEIFINGGGLQSPFLAGLIGRQAKLPENFSGTFEVKYAQTKPPGAGIRSIVYDGLNNQDSAELATIIYKFNSISTGLSFDGKETVVTKFSEILNKVRFPNLVEDLYRQMASNIFKSNRSLAKVVSVSGVDVVVDSVLYLAVGNYLVASSDDNPVTSSLRSTSAVQVVAIDKNSNTITLSGTIAALAADDYLFSRDYVSNEKIEVIGLDKLLPKNPKTYLRTESLGIGGFNKRYENGLYGVSEDCTGKFLSDALIEAVKKIRASGGQPNVIYVNYNRLQDIDEEYRKQFNVYQERIKTDDSLSSTLFGFKKAFIYLPGMPDIMIVGDSYVPMDIAYILNENDIELAIYPKRPDFLNAIHSMPYVVSLKNEGYDTSIFNLMPQISSDYNNKFNRVNIMMEVLYLLIMRDFRSAGIVFNIDKKKPIT